MGGTGESILIGQKSRFKKVALFMFLRFSRRYENELFDVNSRRRKKN